MKYPIILARIVLVLSLVLPGISCEKNTSVDLLTNGTWKLDNGIFSTTRETVKFNTDGSYLIESEMSQLRQLAVMTGRISGDYYRQAELINFTSTTVELPDFNEPGTGIQYETTNGQAIGNFYGYIVNGIWQNDSSLIDSIGSIRYSDLLESGIFQPGNNDIRTWTIISLTNDSLIVKSGEVITKYGKK